MSRLCWFKFLVCLTVVAGGLIYGAELARHGFIFMRHGALLVRTGPYWWSYWISWELAARWLGALAMLALILWPAGTRPLGKWTGVLGAAGGLTLAGLLALTQWTRLELFNRPVLLLAGGLALVFAYWGLDPNQARPPLARLAGLWHRRAGRGTWVLLAALGALVGLASWHFIYRGQPISIDSQSQIAQARLLLSGHWRLDVSQALRDVISFPFAIAGAPSYAQFPPGYILPLVPLLALNLPPQALDTLAAAVTLLLAAALARRVAGRAAGQVAGWTAALLLFGSPFFAGLSGSGMNHAWTTVLLLMAACCFLAASRKGAPLARLCLLGGLALGWATMTRPVTGLAHGLVWSGAWMTLAWQARRAGVDRKADTACLTWPVLRRMLAWTALGLALPAALFLLYNFKTTGNPLVLGYRVSNPAMHRLGFITSGEYRYTPHDAINNTAANLFSLNFLLFGWAIGSWLVPAAWWFRTRLRAPERLLLALILTQTLFYTLYHFHDLFFGPRFLYELLPLAAALGGAGLAPLLARRDRRAGVLGLLILILSLGGLGEGMRFWQEKFRIIVNENQMVEALVRQHEPIKAPTVLLLDEPANEMIGRHFMSQPDEAPLWFVLRKHEAKARSLPELAGYRWLTLKPEASPRKSN